ncbi:MAG: phosphate-starvation-inducible PsiE family protein [Methanoregula sp.]|nr:MAG: phosphate-starvation-inducible PsiE family protein [Methanoregula sp.]
MLELVDKFERIVYAVLMLLLMVVLLFAIGELCYLLISSLTNPPPMLLENHELTNVLGVFLLILIGIELLDTIKAYFLENAIHFEIVILLAIVAIARKVILLDPASAPNPEFIGMELIGIGVVVLGLAGAYFLIKKAGGIVVGGHVEGKPPV